MATTLFTIQDLIDNQMGVSVHCNATGCGHGADLDHHRLEDRLGFDFVALDDPQLLVSKLRCGK